MSYGALRKNAILALNGGAKLGGFAPNTLVSPEKTRSCRRSWTRVCSTIGDGFWGTSDILTL